MHTIVSNLMNSGTSTLQASTSAGISNAAHPPVSAAAATPIATALNSVTAGTGATAITSTMGEAGQRKTSVRKLPPTSARSRWKKLTGTAMFINRLGKEPANSRRIFIRGKVRQPTSLSLYNKTPSKHFRIASKLLRIFFLSTSSILKDRHTPLRTPTYTHHHLT